MREFCRQFSLKPARGRGKVAILDDADDLNEEAANCFLKTLEEPPPRSVLVLVGSSPERQLPTIVSRCQVVRFAPLPEEVVAELLRGKELADPTLFGRLARGRLPGVRDGCLEGDAQIDRRVQLVLVLEALLDALGQQLKC